MKPFDLQAALNGAKVVTRDGREVKIAGYNEDIRPANISLLGWVKSSIGWEECAWFNDGTYNSERRMDIDLFMAPTERKEWIVRYLDESNRPQCTHPYSMIENAKSIAGTFYKATIHEITVID